MYHNTDMDTDADADRCKSSLTCNDFAVFGMVIIIVIIIVAIILIMQKLFLGLCTIDSVVYVEVDIYVISGVQILTDKDQSKYI